MPMAMSSLTKRTPPSAMAKFAVFIFVVGFLLFRPAGLFTTKERSYD